MGHGPEAPTTYDERSAIHHAVGTVHTCTCILPRTEGNMLSTVNRIEFLHLAGVPAASANKA